MKTKNTNVKTLAAANLVKLGTLITADFRAMLAEGKAGQSVLASFRAVIEAAPLNDAKALTALKEDIKLKFGEEYVDKYQIRATILTNARKVVHGGTKGKGTDAVTVAGRGRQALTDVLDKASTFAELRKLMSAAKPEALKEVTSEGSAKAKAKALAASKKAGKVNSTDLPSDRAGAFEAAASILQFCEQFLAAGTEADIIARLEETATLLRMTAKPAPIKSPAAQRKTGTNG